MNPKNQAAAIADTFRRYRSFLLTGHGNPDGDCLGCMCALGIGLRRLGKTATILSLDGVPDLYRFLPGSDTVVTAPAEDACDVAVVLDCEDLGRVGDAITAVRSCATLVEIDHHPSTTREAGLALIDPTCASTAEVLLPVMRAAGIEITEEIATCLLSAIITDTGSFRYSSVRSSTLRAGAELVDAGASPGRIAGQVYESRSFASVKLIGLALAALETTANGRVAYASITQADFVRAGATDADSEGIPNMVRAIRGVDVGLLFREAADGRIRVSLRCRDGLDVSKVARTFGGGGHPLASGCTVDGPLDSGRALVIEAVRKCMGF